MSFLRDLFGKKKKVLVIEDDAEIASLLTDFIRLHGYEAIRAEDGFRGMQMVEEIFPDLVLLDIMLPKMNGFDVLLKIKSQSSTKGVPVLMCSALNGMRDVEKCCEWGAEGYITKPFDLNRVSKKIDSILNHKISRK